MTPVTPHPDGYPIKMVRDNTAAIVNPSGEPGDLFYVSAEDLGLDPVPWLRKKLIEEAAEYVAEPSLEELGQVLGIVSALCEHHDTTFQRLWEYVLLDPRGLFHNHMIMCGRHPEYDK